MRNLVVGFLLGLLVGGSVWAAGSLAPAPSGPGARPDRQWEQDRGASLRDAMQRYGLERSFQLEKQELTNEIERLHRRPC